MNRNKGILSMRVNDFDAVIFDLDGTLVDSMWMWKDIDIEYLNRFGISYPDGLQEDLNGMTFEQTAFYMKDRFSLPVSPVKMMIDWNEMAHDKYLHAVPLKPGVKSFIEKCKANDILLGIASSNSKELIENVLNAHGIAGEFKTIRTGTESIESKPAPDIYLAAAGDLGVAPSKCLVFEDIVEGIMAGKSAGMTVVAVEDDYSQDQKEKKIKFADYYIESYDEIEI